DSSKTDETIEEIRFYVANGMPEQAMAALAKLQTLTSDQHKIAQLRSEVEAAVQAASDQEVQVEEEPVVEELVAEDIPSAEIEVEAEEAPAAIEEPAVAHAAAEAEATVEEMPVAVESVAEAQPEAPAEEPAQAPAALKEFVSD